MERKQNDIGITLIALVVTIIILLILAGISIATIRWRKWISCKSTTGKKTQIEVDMREILVLALQDLQVEKVGKATLDDVTQEWVDAVIKDYSSNVMTNVAISGKIVTMQKDGVTGKYLIDENLNITEMEYDGSSITFSYETGGGIALTDAQIENYEF